MSDRERDTRAPTEEAVWAALAHVRQLTESAPSPNLDVDFAVEKLRDTLLRPLSSSSRKGQETGARMKSMILRLNGRSEGTEACIEWLRKTGKFTATEIATIRRINLFVEQRSGQVIMRRNAMSLAKAAAAISFIFFLAGAFVGCVLSSDGHLGMPPFFALYATCGIMSAITTVLLDRSFRFVRVRDKVSQLAPWL